MFNPIRRWYDQNRHKLWAVIIIVAMILFFMDSFFTSFFGISLPVYAVNPKKKRCFFTVFKALVVGFIVEYNYVTC